MPMDSLRVLTIWAILSATGAPLGFYPEDAFPASEDGSRHPSIPADAVAIDEQTWEALVGDQTLSLVDGKLVEAVFPEPSLVPAAISMRQAKLALLYSGLLVSADAFIAALPGTEGTAARIEWTYGSTMSRDHPLVETLSAHLNLPAAQIDSLFIWAAGL